MMSRRAKIVAALLALAVIGGVVVVLVGGGDAPVVPGRALDDVRAVEGDTDTEDETDLTPTEAPKVVDEPAPPAVVYRRTTNDTRGDSADDGADEYQRYLDETREIIEDNAAEIAAAVGETHGDLETGDLGDLADAFAPDEGDAAAAAAAFADRYPDIISSEFLDTVNVYAVGDATIYIAFAQVVWSDGGHESLHTITVAMRYIDGKWYLSTIDENTPGLVYVQTVML